MRERLGIFDPNQSSLRLIPRLLRNPSVEIAAIVVPDSARGPGEPPAALTHPDPAVQRLLTREKEALLRDPALSAVIDGGEIRSFERRHPELLDRGVAVVSPFVARLLWGLGVHSAELPQAILQALLDVVEAAELAVDPEELCADLLHLALRSSHSDGGSFLLADSDSGELRVGAAVGIERELWPKIRVPRGAGVSGRVADLARPLRLRGPAIEEQFQIVRERRDIAAALCIPVIHEGRVLGVLNLHDRSNTDAYSDDAFRYARRLAKVYARILAATNERAALERRARHDTAARRVSEILAARSSLEERLGDLCGFIAAEIAPGVATLYLAQPENASLALVATSLEGSRFGSEYRLRVGDGIDGTAAASRTAQFLYGADGRPSYAALPLLADGRLIGVLSVQIAAEGARGRDTEPTLRGIASHAAESIFRAERERRAAARAGKLNAIGEHHVRMIEAIDLAEVVRMGTAAAATVLEADHAIVRLRDPRTGRFAIRSYFGAADRSQQTRLFRLDQRVATEAVRRQRAFGLRDLPSDLESSWFTTAAQSAIATPLIRDGRTVGTLSAYDRVAADRFTIGNFDDDDLQALERFAAVFEQAVENASARERADRERTLDAETGLPNAASAAETIRAEIVRAAGRDRSLALVVCSIENIAAIDAIAEGTRTARLAERIAEAMRAHVREFDVIARTETSEFMAVLPEPGPSPTDRIVALTRAVADDIAKDDPLNDPVRVELGFGYALYPDDGRDRRTLVEHARSIRIQML